MAFDRMKVAAQIYAERAQSVVGDATGDHGMEAEGLARQAGGKAQGVFGEAKARVEDGVDAAGDLYEHSGDYAQRGQRAVASSVNDNPLIALTLASALGFLVGLLVIRS